MLDSGHKKVAAGRSDTNDRKQSFCKRLIKTLIFPLLTFITAGNVTSANCRPSERRNGSGSQPHGFKKRATGTFFEDKKQQFISSGKLFILQKVSLTLQKFALY